MDKDSVYLDAFLMLIFGPDAPSWATAHACKRVQLEKYTALGQLDTVVQFKDGVIAIENKPWAHDQENQVTRYVEWLKKSENYLLVFLSNREPSADSIKLDQLTKLRESNQYRQLSYHEAIFWLQAGFEKTKAIGVRVFVEELIKFIRTRVNRELEMNESNEIGEAILKSPDNIEAAFLINQSWTEAKGRLIDRLRKPLEERCSEHEWQVKFDDFMKTGRKGAGFDFYFYRDQNPLIRLRF